MNAITGIENLVQQPSLLNAPYWSAYADTDNEKNKLRDNLDYDNLSIEESEKQLRHIVNQYNDSGCNFVFRFYPVTQAGKVATTSKGFYTIKFHLPAGKQIAGIGGGFNMEDIDSKIAKAVADAQTKWITEQRIAALEKENAELKKEIKESLPGPLERVIGKVEPYVELIMKHTFNDMAPQKTVAAAIAGTGDATAENTTEAQIEAALKTLYEIEGDQLANLLTKLANMALTNRKMYETAKRFL